MANQLLSTATSSTTSIFSLKEPIADLSEKPSRTPPLSNHQTRTMQNPATHAQNPENHDPLPLLARKSEPSCSVQSKIVQTPFKEQPVTDKTKNTSCKGDSSKGAGPAKATKSQAGSEELRTYYKLSQDKQTGKDNFLDLLINWKNGKGKSVEQFIAWYDKNPLITKSTARKIQETANNNPRHKPVAVLEVKHDDQKGITGSSFWATLFLPSKYNEYNKNFKPHYKERFNTFIGALKGNIKPLKTFYPEQKQMPPVHKPSKNSRPEKPEPGNDDKAENALTKRAKQNAQTEKNKSLPQKSKRSSTLPTNVWDKLQAQTQNTAEKQFSGKLNVNLNVNNGALTQLNTEHDTLKSEAVDLLKRELATLQTEAKELRDKIRELTKAKQDVQAQLDAKNTEVEELYRQLDINENRLKLATAENNALKYELYYDSCKEQAEG